MQLSSAPRWCAGDPVLWPVPISADLGALTLHRDRRRGLVARQGLPLRNWNCAVPSPIRQSTAQACLITGWARGARVGTSTNSERRAVHGALRGRPTKDLASRDVCQPLHDHGDPRSGRGVGKDGPDHISTLHLNHLAARNPGRCACRHQVERRAYSRRVTVEQGPIPVLRPLHYNIGRAIPTKLWGEVAEPTQATTRDAIVPGLMAVGEAGLPACMVANRLGSNSLIDLVVFGRDPTDQGGRGVDPDSAAPMCPRRRLDMALSRFDDIPPCLGKHSTAELRLEDGRRRCRPTRPSSATDKTLAVGQSRR